MKLDKRSIPYRILENGVALGAVAVFALLGPLADQGLFGLLAGVALVFVGLAVVVGWQVARWRRFEYELTEDTFDIASGIFSRRHREIPFERIQNVDISQNPVHRLLDIAEVRLETAGGGQSEARLRFVSTQEADRLQNAITQKKRRDRAAAGEADETAREQQELFELRDSELWVLGAVTADLRLLGILATVAPFVLPAVFQEIDLTMTILVATGAALILGSILVLWVISGVYAVLRYYGFRLFREGDELRYERGLLQRYSGSIPTEKIQTVSLAENVLARQLGYASVQIGTAGYAPGQTQGQRVQSAVPIAERDRALSLARQVEPFGDFDFQRPPKRARRRYLARYSLVVLAVVAALGVADVFTEALPWWPAGAALLVLVPPAAHLKWANLGYHVGEDHVVTRKGFWVRKTTVVPYHRIQTVLRSRTVFQRRRSLGTLVVDTAAGGGLRGSDAVALDIDAETAGDLLVDLDERLHRALADRADAHAAGQAG